MTPANPTFFLLAHYYFIQSRRSRTDSAFCPPLTARLLRYTAELSIANPNIHTPNVMTSSAVAVAPPFDSSAASQHTDTRSRTPGQALGRGRGRGTSSQGDHRGGRGRERGLRGLRGSGRGNLQQPPVVVRNGAAGNLSNGLQVNSTEEVESSDKRADEPEKDEIEAEVCFICASPAIHNSIAPCNHRTCHICALRLRALYKSRACAHCRVSRPTLHAFHV